MQNPTLRLLKTLVFSGFALSAVDAQTQRCDVVTKDTTVNGQPAKQCLDLDSLKNKTIVIPSNVTRFDNQGFAICTKSLTTGGNADIVFVVDQSFSMTLGIGTLPLGVNGFAYRPTPTATPIFYQSTSGCSNPWNGGAVASQGFITIQTTVGTRTLALLFSDAGCDQLSGDPYNIRESAVERSIDYIVTTSSSSTVGYLPFAANIQTPVRSQRPLPLTAANVATLKSKIVLDSANGTNYDNPLDSARRWLSSTAITPSTTNKKVIIFITDGAPNPPGNNGLAKNSDGTYRFIDTSHVGPVADNVGRIPIYSIFMVGKPTADTATLQSISNLTHGKFYRVPPQNQDSLASIVRQILNLVLKTYEPATITITNTSITPNQTSTSTGFQDQGTGSSFKILLDSTLALQGNLPNAIVLTSNFRDKATGVITPDITNFTLSTTGPTTSGSVLSGGLITKCYPPTTLRLLNAAGLRPVTNYFTDADNSVQLVLTTSKNGQSTVRPTLRAIVGPAPLDSLKPALSITTADSGRFSSSVNLGYGLSPGTVNFGNATLETKISDSLRACWTNPRDPRDFACDTIPIHPTYLQAFAYFSSNVNGTDTVSLFDSNVTVAYIVVRDQRMDPRYSYPITVTTESFGADQVNLTLIERSPGLFSDTINLSKNLKNGGNNILEFTPIGDVLRATFTDPAVPSDQSNALAGIEKVPPYRSSLKFTDAAGNELPTGAVILGKQFWALTNPVVYMKRFGYNIASQLTIPVQLTARSMKRGQLIAGGVDVESRSLSQRANINSALTSWSGNIPLSESLTPTSGNNILQGAYRIEVTATSTVNDSLGNLIPGEIDSAKLVIAWPDSAASLAFSEALNAADHAGPTDVILTLKDQDFVHAATNETVNATAVCPGPSPQDSVSLVLTQTSSSGLYLAGNLHRDINPPTPADTILSCPADSGVVVHYSDPVYGDSSGVFKLNAQLEILQAHTPVANPPTLDEGFQDFVSVSLGSLTDGALISFSTNNATLADTLPHPGFFQPFIVPIFITDSTVVLRAVATKANYLRSRVITEIYLKQPGVELAFIKDTNGDGSADKFSIKFKKPSIELPTRLDSVFWNEVIPANRRISDVSWSADSLVLTGVPRSAFPQFLTGISGITNDSGAARFPRGGYFNGLRAKLKDSVGPVLSAAEMHPSDLKTEPGSQLPHPDTLIITVSEPLKDMTFGNTFLRFNAGANCSDLTSILTSQPLSIFGENSGLEALTTDQKTFTVIVDNTPGVASPQLGNCIYLSNVGPFVDLSGNLPGLVGVELKGRQSPKLVHSLAGYPPVSGLLPGTKAFNLAVKSNGLSNSDQFITAGSDILWIPPVDFPIDWKKGDIYTPILDTAKLRDLKNNGATKPLWPLGNDQGISLLEVVASTKYTAHIKLVDHLGHFVKSWDQKFGYSDDLRLNKAGSGGVRSFLVWDLRDSKKQLAGTGVYIWNVTFETRNDSTGVVKKEKIVRRTGLVR